MSSQKKQTQQTQLSQDDTTWNLQFDDNNQLSYKSSDNNWTKIIRFVGQNPNGDPIMTWMHPKLHTKYTEIKTNDETIAKQTYDTAQAVVQKYDEIFNLINQQDPGFNKLTKASKQRLIKEIEDMDSDSWTSGPLFGNKYLGYGLLVHSKHPTKIKTTRSFGSGGRGSGSAPMDIEYDINTGSYEMI